MSNKLASRGGRDSRGGAAPPWRQAPAASLYTPRGGRKYLNQDERLRAMAMMQTLPHDRRLFALTLAWTGARPSEVLALCPAAFQRESSIVAVRTLKRRAFAVREVPIPPELMAAVDAHYDLARRQADPDLAEARLWPWSRGTAWRIMKAVMAAAVIAGPQACPRGFRHGFGVGTLQAGVPLNLTQRWLGHARIATTAIYADACGPEEISLASRFWRAGQARDAAASTTILKAAA